MSTTFNVNVGTLTGKSFLVDVNSSDTVRDLKKRIEEEELIPLESQILIYREKTLSDDAAVHELGIEEGSRLQLLVHMAGGCLNISISAATSVDVLFNYLGPGPVMKVKKPVPRDDSIVLLLCKQNDGLYMLEFHLKNEDSSRASQSNNMYKLSRGLSPLLITAEDITSLLENNSEITQSADEPSKPSSSVDKNHARPKSSESSISMSSFTSIFSNDESLPHSAESHKLSINNTSSIKYSKSIQSAKFIKSRPSTAISIMRLSEPPSVTIIKSRPATAVTIKSDYNSISKCTTPQQMKVKSSDKSNDITSPATPKVKGTTPSKNLKKQASSKNLSHSNMQSSKKSTPETILKKKPTSSNQTPSIPLKCNTCRKKLQATTVYKCRCMQLFCSIHRYTDRHKCSYNYKEAGKHRLQKENPKVSGFKIEKI
jgi:hypothetical protein